MDKKWSIIDILWQYAPALAIAIMAGAVRVLRVAEKNQMTAKGAVAGLAGSCFVGIIMILILYDIDMPESVKGAIIGVAAYGSGKTLELLEKHFLDRAGKFLDGN